MKQLIVFFSVLFTFSTLLGKEIPRYLKNKHIAILKNKQASLKQRFDAARELRENPKKEYLNELMQLYKLEKNDIIKDSLSETIMKIIEMEKIETQPRFHKFLLDLVLQKDIAENKTLDSNIQNSKATNLYNKRFAFYLLSKSHCPELLPDLCRGYFLTNDLQTKEYAAYAILTVILNDSRLSKTFLNTNSLLQDTLKDISNNKNLPEQYKQQADIILNKK